MATKKSNAPIKIGKSVKEQAMDILAKQNTEEKVIETVIKKDTPIMSNKVVKDDSQRMTIKELFGTIDHRRTVNPISNLIAKIKKKK